ncbi:MAG TPA: ATP-binding protein, partial [Polyangiales bacterium]|nr:ATP-binding protein [Polyangiales bacterium]
LTWWFVCEWLLPGSFNPLLSRLAVVLWFFASFALASRWNAARRQSESLYYVGSLLLLSHYGYLLHHNAQDPNWILGAYVLVFALCASVASRRWLYALAVYSFAGSCVLIAVNAQLRTTIFLPGLTTILGLCMTVLLQRVRLLESLSENTARFQSLFDATFEGVAVHDQGIIVDVNGALAQMFGYTRDELIGRSADELSAPEVRERVAAHMRSSSGSRYEAIGLRKDGSQFALEISGKPHHYAGRLLRVTAVRDISDRQRAEQEHITRVHEQAARVSAQEALRLRDEFISIASHELRTPITSLLLNLEVFVPRWRAGQRDFETYATRVRRSLRRMKRLVDELFDASRLDAGKLALTEEPVDLATVVHDVTEAMAEDLHRGGCGLTVHSGGDLHGVWDRLRLEQVLENLLRNALIYGAGKPIEVTVGDAGGRALMTVRDHGMGIAREHQERIFLRYERGVSVRNYGGLGLGLYIARQIVEAHGGLIRVESEPGEGATFTVELPMQPSERPLVLQA